MSLDDVVKGYKRYSAIAGPSNAMDHDVNSVNSPDVYGSYLKYLQDYHGLTSAQAEVMMDSDEPSPRITIRNAQMRRLQDHGTLAQTVEQNYGALVKDIPEKKLAEFALDLPEKGKDYIFLENAIQNKDYEAIRAVLGKEEYCGEWKRFIGKLKEPELTAIAQRFMEIEREEFKRKKLCDESEKDGKKFYTLNAEKIRAYLKGTIDSYKPQDREEIYIRLAGLYAQKEKD